MKKNENLTLKVLRTFEREGTKDDYAIFVNSGIKKILGDFAVIEFKPISFIIKYNPKHEKDLNNGEINDELWKKFEKGIDIVHPPEPIIKKQDGYWIIEFKKDRPIFEVIKEDNQLFFYFSRKLKVPCRVVLEERNNKNSKKLENDEIRMDQSLRNAVGIPFDFKKGNILVTVSPLRISFSQRVRYLISYILGRRYLFFRVCSANISDMEKRLCRITEDSFNLLGCEAGDRIICESFGSLEENRFKLRFNKIKAYGCSEKMIEYREKNEKSDPTRYPPAQNILGVKHDIPRIFLDQEMRLKLRVDLMDPIRARRDLGNLFFKQLIGFGVIFLLSALAIVEVFITEKTWQSIIIMFSISLIISLLIILLNIRSKVI